MPRITKATRTSLPVNSNKYNLNERFRDYVNGNQYFSNEKLILWTDMSNPGTVASSMPGYDVICLDQSSTSIGYGNHQAHTLPGVGFLSRRHEDTINFCGNKDYFSYEAAKGAATGTGISYDSPMTLVFSDHNNLSFGSLGVDSPFTISFWIYSRAAAGLFDINEGGTNPAGNPLPTFFEKYKEYSLRLDTSGRLRMSLYSGGTLGAYIYAESITSVFTDNVWNNIVITYNGSKDPGGIRMYRNGVSIKDPSRNTTVGTYSGMANTSTKLTFANASPSNPEKQTSMPGLPGGGLKIAPVFLSEIAVWGSELTDEEIRAVYHGTRTCAATDTARESGYISEPPRLRIRRMDNATGSYPTANRVGDTDFRGIFNVNYNDLNTIIYGEKIVDEFSNIRKVYPPRDVSKGIDRNKWVFTEGLEIRRETLQGFNGSTFTDGVLVFRGTTSGSNVRSLRTKNKVRNASLYFELIQGPHNNYTTEAAGQGLKLEEGGITEVLKLQFSLDGVSNWTTIRSYTPTNLIQFYGKTDIATFMGGGQTPPPEKNRYRKRIYINFSDINAGNNDYYLRFVQETSEREYKAVWGLGRIEITSMNQRIRYPLLVDHDSESGRKISKSAIQTPHTRSDITTIGRSLPHSSDHFVEFTPGENLSPFKEHNAIENLDPTHIFYSMGSNPRTGVQGFSSKLADKTKIMLTLGEDNTNLKIGHTDRHSSDDPENNQSLAGAFAVNMVTGRPLYPFRCSFISTYRKSLNSWGSYSMPNHAYNVVSAGGFHDFIKKDIYLGFGAIDTVASRSMKTSAALPDIENQFGPDVLSNYGRPIKTFGFPFAEKFERRDNDCIEISDYITKPFLLEKVVVDFKAAFEFAENGALGENAYSLFTSYFDAHTSGSGAPYPGERSAIGPRFFLPTFFILNQYKSSNSSKLTLKNQQYNESSGKTEITYNDIVFDNEHNSRELVTYGQMCLYASSSENYGINVEKLIVDGLGRDLNVDILRKTGQSGIDIETTSISPFTSSFKLEFPCRVSGKTDYNQKLILLTGSAVSSSPSDNLLNAYYMADPTGGRSINHLERGSRGLINNYVSRTPGEEYKTFGLYKGEIPSTVKTTSRETIDQYSPYIMLPGDKLIFGWQYPINTTYGTTSTGNTDQKRNIMTILGKVKVHLYGSLMSNSSEHHEYNNTPLTSNAIHELIGSEKPIDQFQIATRGELSGSYIDRWTCFEEIWDHPAFGIPSFKIHSDASVKPTERVGSLSLSIADNKQNNMPVLNPSVGVAIQSIAQNIVNQLSEEDQVQRFVRLKSQENMFLDSVYKENDFFYNSSYGTMQTYAGLSGSVQTHGWNSTTRPWMTNNAISTRVTPSRPKYYFNYRHFGYFSDKIQQGKDGKMWRDRIIAPPPSIEDLPEENQYFDVTDQNTAAVVVQFVSSSRTTNLSTIVYKKAKYTDIISGSSEIHQMYNSDIFSTSSIPYRDDIRTLIFTENTR